MEMGLVEITKINFIIIIIPHYSKIKVTILHKDIIVEVFLKIKIIEKMFALYIRHFIIFNLNASF